MKLCTFISLLMTSSLLAFTSCQMPAPTQQGTLKSATLSPQTSFKPYTGPVSLSIDTGLATKTAGKRVVLSSQNQGFQTLSTASSKVIFEETFTHIENMTVERNVSVDEPKQNHILEVIRHDSQGNDTKMGVEINDVVWVKAKDFQNGVDMVSREHLLLQSQNLLKLTPQGPKGGRVTVRLRTGDSAGTLLRPQEQWTSGIPTQGMREANEQNLFNPNVVASLGVLEPYEGDVIDTDNPNAPIVGIVDTQGALTKIQVGYLTAYINEPVATNLAILQSQFPVDVVFQEQILGDTMVSLKIRLNEVALSKMPSQWQQLNQRADRPPIESATFSSLNTAKTLAVLTDMHVNRGEWLKDVGFSNILEKTTVPIIPQEANNPQNDGLWWLYKIQANKAWHYSMGEEATVVILDSNFGYGFSESTPDVAKGRVKTRPFKWVDPSISYDITLNRYLDDYSSLAASCSLKQNPRDMSCYNDARDRRGHGGEILSLIAAGLNNDEGSVGVAPETRILPFYLAAGEANPMLFQLQQLLDLVKSGEEKIDVINISFRYNVSPLGVYFASISYALRDFPEARDATETFALRLLDAESKKTVEIIDTLALNHGITVVASAGNDGKPINVKSLMSENKTMAFPAVVPTVISVGAYDKQQHRAEFNPQSPGFVGSNYSTQVSLWAPGKDLISALYNKDTSNGLTDNSKYEPTVFSKVQGTSFAAPLVAGAVALIRSANPNLKPWEIKEILQETADAPPDPSSFLVPGETYPVYLLNVLKAMQHPKVGAKPADAYNLKVASQGYLVDYERRVPSSGNSSSNPTNSTVSLFEGSLSNYPEIKDGDCVKVVGWTHDQQSRVPFGQVKPLSIEKDPNPPLKCNESFRTQAIPTGSNAPTQEDPFRTQSIAFPQSTSYIKVTLSGDSQSQKLYLRHKDLDGNSTATASLSDSPEQHEAQANKVALGTDFTEVGTLSGTQTVIIAVTNSGNTSDFYTVEMALAPTDNRRVVVQATSSFSMGPLEPVQVVLNIKDSNGNPANGRYFVGLDRNAGTFNVLAPVAGPYTYQSSGAFVDVVNGYVLLEYLPNTVRRDYGISQCGDTPCKALSARFQVSGCDYSYYGTQRCPIIGPDATGPSADEGRVYSTWLNGWGEPQVLNIRADGQQYDIELGGLTDSAGRVVPDGYLLYVTEPYWGDISRMDGSTSGVWLTIGTQGGALRLRYTANKTGLSHSCWPYGSNAADTIVFDDSRYSESWYATAARFKYVPDPAANCN